MADTPEILPTYMSFRQKARETPCPFCLHWRWMPLWKHLLHDSAVSVMPQNLPAGNPAAGASSPPVAISFVDDESQTRPVSEIVEAIANPNSPGVSSVNISRNEINAVVQALKVFLAKRNKVTKVPSKYGRSSTAQPALRRCRSLP
ncbi:hypothetical protein BD410DRAFT_833476 [Rickenella mellea]|uniref:Uncharacterized protein n=1 Tax=Rickenella mellea TaxID=50990 RepID=A0A4V3AZH2_9AGAM|nr:hypothetical protein BD410DRAFT_833476 [Rickenella mellea]